MKTDKIEKELWRQILKEATFIQGITVEKIQEKFNIPKDKAELVLQSVQFSRNKSKAHNDAIRTKLSKNAQFLIADMRERGVKWKEIAEVLNMTPKHCMKLHAKTKLARKIEEEMDLDENRKAYLEALLSGELTTTTVSYTNNCKNKTAIKKLSQKELEYIKNSPLYNEKYTENLNANLSFYSSLPRRGDLNKSSISNFTNDTFLKNEYLVQIEGSESDNMLIKSDKETYAIAKSLGYTGSFKDLMLDIMENGSFKMNIETRGKHTTANLFIRLKQDGDVEAHYG